MKIKITINQLNKNKMIILMMKILIFIIKKLKFKENRNNQEIKYF